MTLFNSAIIAALALGSPLILAEKYSHQKLNTMLGAGQFDTEKILAKATPLRGAGRKLEDSVSSSTSIRFNKCMTLSVEDEGLLADQTLMEYAKNGTIVSQQSFVLFDVQDCEPGNCVFDESDMESVYMVPLEVFLNSMVGYYPNKRETYCDECYNFYNYCTSGGGGYFDTGTYANGGEFCYKGQEYKLINCNQCSSYGCYGSYNNEDAQEYQNMDNTLEWVDEVTACKDLDSTWQNYELYGGMMCNQDGDGVEFAVFVDQYCRYYHKGKSFQKVIQSDEFGYYYKAPEVVQFMFTNSISCAADDDVTYISANQPAYQDDGGECNSYEMNDSCSNLFGGLSLSLATCSNGGDAASYNQNENYDENHADWDESGLYDYQLSKEVAYDESAICEIIGDVYKSGDHKNLYDENGSGSLFEYNNSKDPDKKKFNPFGVKNGADFSALDVFAYLLLAAATLNIAYLAYKRYRRAVTRLVVNNSDKNVPLIDEEKTAIEDYKPEESATESAPEKSASDQVCIL